MFFFLQQLSVFIWSLFEKIIGTFLRDSKHYKFDNKQANIKIFKDCCIMCLD